MTLFVCSVFVKVRKMKAKGDFAGKICVVVGTITDDLRLYEVPALKVCLLLLSILKIKIMYMYMSWKMCLRKSETVINKYVCSGESIYFTLRLSPTELPLIFNVTWTLAFCGQR